MHVDSALHEWLLDSDPALRWQVERDIVRVPRNVWEATRARVATEGFGARLLALQDSDGQWAGGAFFPKGVDLNSPNAADVSGQPWLATTWSRRTCRQTVRTTTLCASRLLVQHEVRGVGTRDVLCAEVPQGQGVDTSKQVLSLAKHDGADRDMHFVDKP